jgi:putative membrane protein
LDDLARAEELPSDRSVKPPPIDDAIMAIERPHRNLWTYYLLSCLVIPPLFPILVLPAYFRFHTMRYRFTDEGISMRWGILFRREVIVNYARIQDIHLRSNVVERWLGLAKVLIQTASGSSSAEMVIEGVREFEAVRDFLYARMRGVKEPVSHAATSRMAASATGETDAETARELVAALRETANELREVRKLLELGAKDSSEGGPHV